MVYRALKISRLGVDKTGWTKLGKNPDFRDCHVFDEKRIFGVLAFCAKIQAFFQPKLVQKTLGAGSKSLLREF